MIKSPSKFLSRGFLRGLLAERCLSPMGVEYCEAEVKDLLHEKESRLASDDYDRELKRLAANWEFNAEIIKDFQDTLIDSRHAVPIPGILRGQENTCQDLTHVELFSDQHHLPLPELNSFAEIAPPSTASVKTDQTKQQSLSLGELSPEAKRGNRSNQGMKIKGKPISEAQLLKELDSIDQWHEKETEKLNKWHKRMTSKPKRD